MSGGGLKKQLDEVEVFSEKRARFYAAEITLAIQLLHQHWILNRDVKLENVLVDADRHCKIADFGLSKLGLFRHNKTSTVWNAVLYGSRDSEEIALWPRRRLVGR
jgi:novel protein kinase C epsilon type